MCGVDFLLFALPMLGVLCNAGDIMRRLIAWFVGLVFLSGVHGQTQVASPLTFRNEAARTGTLSNLGAQPTPATGTEYLRKTTSGNLITGALVSEANTITGAGLRPMHLWDGLAGVAMITANDGELTFGHIDVFNIDSSVAADFLAALGGQSVPVSGTEYLRKTTSNNQITSPLVSTSNTITGSGIKPERLTSPTSGDDMLTSGDDELFFTEHIGSIEFGGDSDERMLDGLGFSALGRAMARVANPSPAGIRFMRLNSDLGVTLRTASEFRADIGALLQSDFDDFAADPVNSGDFDAANWRAGLELNTSAPTAIGRNLLTLPNPGAVRFLRINADNTPSARSASDFRNDIQAVYFADYENGAGIDASAWLYELSGVLQPLDSDLTSIAGLTTTSYGRSLLTQANAAAAVTTLGLPVASNIFTLDGTQTVTGAKLFAAPQDGTALSLRGNVGTPPNRFAGLDFHYDSNLVYRITPWVPAYEQESLRIYDMAPTPTLLAEFTHAGNLLLPNGVAIGGALSATNQGDVSIQTGAYSTPTQRWMEFRNPGSAPTTGTSIGYRLAFDVGTAANWFDTKKWAGAAARTTASNGDQVALDFYTQGNLGSDPGNAPTVKMTLLGSGNLGIGTTTPSEKLDVNGNVNVAGTVTASGTITTTGTDMRVTGGTTSLPTAESVVTGKIGDAKYVPLTGTVTEREAFHTVGRFMQWDGNSTIVNFTANGGAVVTNSNAFIDLSTGTSTNGSALSELRNAGSINGATNRYEFGSWSYIATGFSLVVPTLSDGTDTFIVVAGLAGPRATADVISTRGAWFRVSGSALVSVTGNNTSYTETTLADTVVAGTAIKLRVVLRPGIDAAFYVNGVLRATHTTHVPLSTTPTFSPSVQIIKSLGTTARAASLNKGWFALKE